MGVDNNGMLIVGLEDKDFNYDALPDLAEYDDSIEGWAWANRSKLPAGMELRDITAGYWRHSIIGFVVGDSGSYKYKEIEDAEGKISTARAAFEGIFGVKPRVFILNRQW